MKTPWRWSFIFLSAVAVLHWLVRRQQRQSQEEESHRQASTRDPGGKRPGNVYPLRKNK